MTHPPRPLGVVLAGGPSSRFGRDKASLEIEVRGDSLSLLAWATMRLLVVCDEVVVAARGRSIEEALVQTRSTPGSTLARIESVADGPAHGPAAGLLGAAKAHPDRDYLLLACDLPLVPTSLLRILSQPSETGRKTANWKAPDWKVPASFEAGSARPLLEPTCALYGPRAVEIVAMRAAEGRFSLQGLGREGSLETHFCSPSELAVQSRWHEVFINLNRPEDLERFEALMDRQEEGDPLFESFSPSSNK